MRTNYIFFFFFAFVAIVFGTQYVISQYSAVAADDSQPMANRAGLASAVFAGGCFWCVEADFEKVNGVVDAVSGYAGGHVENPTYKQVSSGTTGHLESVQVWYDPKIVTYKQLLDAFWRHINPTDSGGQFVDRGGQYRSAIFYQNDEQKRIAQASLNALAASGVFDKPIATEIIPLKQFYEAEEYHQDYYKKHKYRYSFYRYNSGRDAFLERAWAKENEMKGQQHDKDTKAALRDKLTPLQFNVTQENGTEPPFKNAYWDNKHEGIYVDIVSGEALFSSRDKFDSGTGWPSFTKPLVPDNIIEKKDRSWLMARTEVRSRQADSHLGHVFDDGPPPTGLRYCINSAALRFIPREDLKKEGYEAYLPLFKEKMTGSIQ